MRVAIYSRVSLLIQSNELQLDALAKFAEKNDHVVVDTYIDTVTGDMEKRGNVPTRYNDLICDARAKKFDAVLVWKLDRLTRSLVEVCSVMKTLRELNINFISATENIDTSGPVGKLMYQILGMFAEFERENITQRLRAGRKYVQTHGVNTKGEPCVLGRPEKISDEIKELILTHYIAGTKFSIISKLCDVPLPTLYSVIKRSVLPCSHGKYRCKDCRKLGRVPIRLDAFAATSDVERRSPKVP